jgi:nitrate/nitrite-specific signal transduction histidine kinase
LPAGAAHLGSGDLGRRITIKTGDEVKALAAQFNDMAGRLAASYAKLEKKVELRTQELSESLQQQTATSDVTVRYLEFSQRTRSDISDHLGERCTSLKTSLFGPA